MLGIGLLFINNQVISTGIFAVICVIYLVALGIVFRKYKPKMNLDCCSVRVDYRYAVKKWYKEGIVECSEKGKDVDR